MIIRIKRTDVAVAREIRKKQQDSARKRVESLVSRDPVMWRNRLTGESVYYPKVI